MGFAETGPFFSNLYLFRLASVGKRGRTAVIEVVVDWVTSAFYPHTYTKLWLGV